ncbi:MAG: DUF899 domain-containing protein [Streptosporangiaceae bacterium]|jgi:predicted dithiol-disulfide oxidoreductase (DUF899 family)
MKTGTRQEWLAARLELLKAEKEHTRRGDELALRRRELPWVPVEGEYTFQTADGTKTLAQLFGSRSQLVVYHFMFGPDFTAGCPICSSTADSFNGVLSHLKACDVEMICISRAPIGKLLAYRERMGWSFNWASSYDTDFNLEFGVTDAHEPTYGWARRAPAGQPVESGTLKLLNESPPTLENLPPFATRNATAAGTDVDSYFSEGHGMSTFAREGDTVFHCYTSYARGTEPMMGYYAILDLAPKGRNEDNKPLSWLRRHNEYGSQ